mgnify:CR=1 FL=1|jgi:hypothetical protein|tara:strand:- start:6 stop:3230 length:3225 start_codon:yes stop_codon:yes gene_type:complete
MADTGKQSPLGMNVLGGILQNRCLQINPNAEFFMGISKSNSDYTYGELISGTILRMLTWSINDGYARGVITDATYNNLISISGDNNECYALGNSKPPTYIAVDPSSSWATNGVTADCKAVEFGVSQGVAGSLPAPANAGYSVKGDTDYGQQATWLPYDTTNANKSITQWGWIRCHALQAHNEFNFHAKVGSEGANLDSNPDPQYENFCGSFNEAASFCQYTNKTITTANNADTFLEGTFSNMNDLITGDVTGVSLFTDGLSKDLQDLQKIFDFKRLDRFGYPSTLLQQLYQAGGLTQDLNLTLGSAGLSAKEIRTLSAAQTHGIPSQERKIYTAFLAVTGVNLTSCVSSLTSSAFILNRVMSDFQNEDTIPIRTLADLLDPYRLFTRAWSTLTVPVYNDEVGRPTGSKTYYLIYNDNGSVNSAINTDAVKSIVGTLITRGAPDINTGTASDLPSTELPTGFDSYLGGSNIVIPANIGLAAAALRYSFLQISNIEQITPGTLGNCIAALETMSDVGVGADGTEPTAEAPLTKPVNKSLVSEVPKQMGLGSGPGGAFSMNDFFGNMSGVPFAWNLLYDILAGNQELESSGTQGITANANQSALAAIYQQLFLAISWETATGSVQTSLRAEETGVGTNEYNYFYTITGLTLTDEGGGYGRGGAPDPDVTISGTSGATATIDGIGRNDEFTGSNSTGTFGRVTSLTLTSPGTEVQYASAQPSSTPTDPGLTVDVETPPIGTYSWLPATGGTNSPNGTAYDYDTVVQYYINASNSEITIIATRNENQSGIKNINVIWDIMGKQMKVEQRTRYNSLGRVEVPRDPFIYSNQDLVTFVDSIPDYSDYQNINTVDARVTLESIVDRNCDVGQNIVAQMRQARNEKALSNCGIPINNNIPDSLSEFDASVIQTNGTLEGAREGIELDGKEWMNPKWVNVIGPGLPPFTPPGGVVGPGDFTPINSTVPGTFAPLFDDVEFPQIGPLVSAGIPNTIVGDPFTGTFDFDIGPAGTGGITTSGGGTGGAGVSGNDDSRLPPATITPGFDNNGVPPGQPNPPYVPAQSAQDAIDRVIHCNCDCWDLIG